MHKVKKNLASLSKTDIDEIIKSCYDLLGLITFYAVKGKKEIRAFAIKKNTNILEAAQQLHSDFAEKFIKAEVTNKNKTLIRGKDYLVQNNDVIEFKI